MSTGVIGVACECVVDYVSLLSLAVVLGNMCVGQHGCSNGRCTCLAKVVVFLVYCLLFGCCLCKALYVGYDASCVFCFLN